MPGERFDYTIQRDFTPRKIVQIALELRRTYAALLRVHKGYDKNHTSLTEHPDLPLLEEITGLRCFLPATIHEPTVREGEQILIVAPTEHDMFAKKLFRQVIDNLASRLPFSEY